MELLHFMILLWKISSIDNKLFIFLKVNYFLILHSFYGHAISGEDDVCSAAQAPDRQGRQGQGGQEVRRQLQRDPVPHPSI